MISYSLYSCLPMVPLTYIFAFSCPHIFLSYITDTFLTFLRLSITAISLEEILIKALPHSSTFYMALARSTYPEGLQPSEFRWRIFPPLYSLFFTQMEHADRVLLKGIFFFIAHWYALKISKKKRPAPALKIR